jgi:serine/threonine protein kinase
MAIPSGTKFGSYEVVAQIGAGGMDEVYRAWCTRLNRTVAVEVLPPHLAGRFELREHFER